MKSPAGYGFSLIELMVVIAIVALLAAVAIPSYKLYSVRSRIIEPMQKMDRIMNDAKVQYMLTGSYPTTVNVNGVTLSSAAPAWTAINWGSIVSAVYQTGAAYQAGATGVVLSVTISGLEGIPGYVASSSSTPASTGTYTMLNYGIRADSNGIIKTGCGTDPLYISMIPVAYLPSGYNCASITGFVAGTACQ